VSSAAAVFDFGYAEGGEQQMVELLYHLLGLESPHPVHAGHLASAWDD